MKNIIQKIFDRHSLGTVLQVTSLKGGTFNSVYRVSTENKEYAIKIVADKQKEVLTYEKGLIKTEVKVYGLLNNVDCIPQIYGYNYTDEYEYKYLIMDFIEGQTLNKTKLGKEEYDGVMYSLGRAMAEIHWGTGEGFGYMQCGLKGTMREAYHFGYIFETIQAMCEVLKNKATMSIEMREAYLSMTDNLIADARRKVKDIPFSDRVRKVIDKNISAFDGVSAPVLTHFDLWGGNIIIKDNRLSALIDCERAMLGVPEGDFISLDYLAPFDKEKSKALLEGYNSVASEKLTFEGDSLKRFYLMRLQLGLIVFTESHYRYARFTPMYIGSKLFGKKVIANALKQLEKI